MQFLLCRDRRRAEEAIAIARQLAKGNASPAVARDLQAKLLDWTKFEPNWRLWLEESKL